VGKLTDNRVVGFLTEDLVCLVAIVECKALDCTTLHHTGEQIQQRLSGDVLSQAGVLKDVRWPPKPMNETNSFQSAQALLQLL
jgi:hypothetical protein